MVVEVSEIRLFIKHLVQADIKENMKALWCGMDIMSLTWILCDKITFAFCSKEWVLY